MNPNFLMLGLMLVFIVFFMILPQRNRMKKEKEFERSLSVGDKIITKSGIHGRIAELNETTVVIETMAGKLLLEKVAISMEMTAKMNKPDATKK